MIVEIINADGEFEDILAKHVVSLAETSQYVNAAGECVPCLHVRLTSGAIVVAQHDTRASFRLRLDAATGGMPLHVHRIDPAHTSQRGPVSLRSASAAAQPAPPAPTEPVVPTDRAPPQRQRPKLTGG